VGYVDLLQLQEEEHIHHAAPRGAEKGIKKQRRAAHKEERNKASRAPVIPIDDHPSNPVDRPLKKAVLNPIVRQSTSQAAVVSHPAEYQHNKMMSHSSAAAQQGKGRKVFDSRAMLEKDRTGPLVQDSHSQLLHHKPNPPVSRKAGRGGGGLGPGPGGKHSHTAAGRGGGGGGSVRLEPLRKQPAPLTVAPRPAATKKVSPGDWFLEDDTPW